MEAVELPPLSAGARWADEARRALIQEPLIETGPSLRSLARVGRRRPRAIFVGVGLCSERRLARALPLDVLGLLIPAERMRRACRAGEVVVLIADRHAAISGFCDGAVEERAAAVERTLRAIAAHPRLRIRVVRASSLHDLAAHRRIRADLERRLETVHPYVIRQLADTAFLDGEYGGIWKLGWTLGGETAGDGAARVDERYFDGLFRRCYGERVGFLYGKPGRALSDRRPRAAPYLAAEPQRRVCLTPGERPARKLEAAPRLCSAAAANGVRRHLKRIVYSYRRQLGPVPRGPLGDRLTWLIGDLLGAADSRQAPRQAVG